MLISSEIYSTFIYPRGSKVKTVFDIGFVASLLQVPTTHIHTPTHTPTHTHTQTSRRYSDTNTLRIRIVEHENPAT